MTLGLQSPAQLSLLNGLLSGGTVLPVLSAIVWGIHVCFIEVLHPIQALLYKE